MNVFELSIISQDGTWDKYPLICCRSFDIFAPSNRPPSWRITTQHAVNLTTPHNLHDPPIVHQPAGSMAESAIRAHVWSIWLANLGPPRSPVAMASPVALTIDWRCVGETPWDIIFVLRASRLKRDVPIQAISS